MARIDRQPRTSKRTLRALQRAQAASPPAMHLHEGNQTPAGAVDGANRVFELAAAPLPGTLQLFKNGLLMSEGADDDYTRDAATITFVAEQTPQAGDKLRAWYQTEA